MSTFQVTVHGSILGQVHENVLYFNDTSWPGGPFPTLTNVAEIIRDNWIPQIKTLHTTALVWSSINVREVSATPAAPISLAINIPGTGTNDAGTLPFVAICIQFKTATGTRHGRGRMHLGGIPTNRFTNGLVTAAALTSFETIRTQLKNLFGATGHSTGLTQVIRPKPNAGNIGATSHTVQDYILRTTASMQRRRNFGYGV